MENAAAVVIDETFGQRAFSDDDIVAFQLDVKIFDVLDAFGLHDRDAVDEVSCLDQHTLQIHRMMW